MKKISSIILVMTLVFSACQDPFLGSQYIEKTNANLDLSNAEFLKKHEDKYSMWIELLKYANLYNALNDAAATSTVFAPDNEAVTKFLEWKGVSSIQELDQEYARNVAKAHILKGIIKENDFIAYVEKGQIPTMSLFGSYLTTSYGYRDLDVDDDQLEQVALRDSFSIYLNNQAKVANLGRADTTANGRIYTLHDVIRPLSETVLEVLENYKDYTIFVEAAKKTGYDQVVKVYADTVLNANGSISVNDVRFTCLAVPDEVYKAAGINSATDLASYLSAGSDYTSTENALYKYVAYHFLGKTYTKTTLTDYNQPGEVLIFDTKLKGKVITVEAENGVNKINKTAQFIRSNIKARNGVIHKIDQILPVFDPSPMRIVWDFCNMPDVESFVNSYGAAKFLGQLFSSDLTNKEYQIDLSLDKLEGNYGTITSFMYVGNETKSPVKTWRRVGYFKCAYNSSADAKNDKYGALMHNLLILNLGFAGNVTMTTPTIIKGKYKVVLYYAGAPGLRSFYPTGSNTKIKLDDYQKSIFMWKGIPATFVDPLKRSNINANGIASEVLWESITFDESGTHSLKATLMDINAKTNTSYRQMWDYMEFIPIEN